MSIIKNSIFLLMTFFVAHGYKVQTIFELGSLTFDIKPNPYFANWEAIISPDKRTLTSVKVPFSQDLPKELMIKGEVQYKGTTTAEFDVLACEYISDPFFMPEVLEHGRPEGVFPQECPIYKCEDCEIQNLVIPGSKIPQGTPDGEVTMVVELYEVGKPTYAYIYSTGQIKNVPAATNNPWG